MSVYQRALSLFSNLKKYLVDFQVALGFWVMAVRPLGKGSIRRQAENEVRNLSLSNPTLAEYRYTRGEILVDYFDRHKRLMISLYVFLCLTFLVAANLSAWAYYNFFDQYFYIVWGNTFSTCDPSIDSCPKSDSFHAIIGTVQATIVSLILPITVLLYDLVLKGRKLKAEMINFVLRESRIGLITLSSFSLLIWLGVLETAKVSMQFLWLSLPENILEMIWMAVNMAFIGYFMMKVVNLLNSSNFDAAVRRFTVNVIYPDELRSYIRTSRLTSLFHMFK